MRCRTHSRPQGPAACCTSPIGERKIDFLRFRLSAILLLILEHSM
jgi:hypothetical protein